MSGRRYFRKCHGAGRLPWSSLVLREVSAIRQLTAPGDSIHRSRMGGVGHSVAGSLDQDRPATGGAGAIVGRDGELARLTRLVGDRPVRGAAVVVAGPPGMGVSTLLAATGAAADRAGLRVLRATGAQTEQGLPFAGLHQLLRTVLAGAERLPPRQRSALVAAFGLGDEPASADPMMVGLAVLALLSELADRRPVLLLVDDAQWVDMCSLRTLGFVARRLAGEPVVAVFGVRDPEPPAALARGLEWLELGPLDRDAAERLLARQPRPPTGELREQVLRHAVGTPLALVELARAIADDPVAGRYWATAPLPLTDRLERLYAADLAALPAPTRALLLLAATGGDGMDPAALLTAAPDGGDPAWWQDAERAGLVVLREQRVEFRHPLIRSAVYHAAPAAQRRRAHLALAELCRDDPDQAARHRAAAALGPDAEVAAALEATGERARDRGAHGTAAAALERSARLSPDRGERARRLVLAAGQAVLTDRPAWVERLTRQAADLTTDPLILAEASVQAGWVLLADDRHGAALDLLLPAAERVASSSPDLSLSGLATAGMAAYHSGSDRHRAALAEVLARVLPRLPPGPAGRLAWPLAAADPIGNRAAALAALAAGPPDREPTTVVALGNAAWLLDETSLSVRLLGDVLDLAHRADRWLTGGTANVLAAAYTDAGRWSEALVTAAHAGRLAADAGLRLVAAKALVREAVVLAYQGQAQPARGRASEALAAVDPGGSGSVAAWAHRAAGLAAAGENDPESAYQHLRRLFGPDGEPTHFHASYYGLAELAAAAARTGHRDVARRALDRAARALAGAASPRLRLLLHRGLALVTTGRTAEAHFWLATADPAGGQWPYERAQARLDYAEWLRRQRRITEARPLLVDALAVFDRLGARPAGERARAELRAAGQPTGPPAAGAFTELTPQQQNIVRLAATGLTNREIGERLFLSPRTVGSHLYRTFPKLGITTRAQLRDLLVAGP